MVAYFWNNIPRVLETALPCIIFYILIFNRILFPFLSNEDKNLSCYGYCKADESVDSGDPDDYVSIDSG